MNNELLGPDKINLEQLTDKEFRIQHLAAYDLLMAAFPYLNHKLKR